MLLSKLCFEPLDSMVLTCLMLLVAIYQRVEQSVCAAKTAGCQCHSGKNIPGSHVQESSSSDVEGGIQWH